jgi:hypothetical protein
MCRSNASRARVAYRNRRVLRLPLVGKIREYKIETIGAVSFNEAYRAVDPIGGGTVVYMNP